MPCGVEFREHHGVVVSLYVVFDKIFYRAFGLVLLSASAQHGYRYTGQDSRCCLDFHLCFALLGCVERECGKSARRGLALLSASPVVQLVFFGYVFKDFEQVLPYHLHGRYEQALVGRVYASERRPHRHHVEVRVLL